MSFKSAGKLHVKGACCKQEAGLRALAWDIPGLTNSENKQKHNDKHQQKKKEWLRPDSKLALRLFHFGISGSTFCAPACAISGASFSVPICATSGVVLCLVLAFLFLFLVLLILACLCTISGVAFALLFVLV